MSRTISKKRRGKEKDWKPSDIPDHERLLKKKYEHIKVVINEDEKSCKECEEFTKSLTCKIGMKIDNCGDNFKRMSDYGRLSRFIIDKY